MKNDDALGFLILDNSHQALLRQKMRVCKSGPGSPIQYDNKRAGSNKG